MPIKFTMWQTKILLITETVDTTIKQAACLINFRYYNDKIHYAEQSFHTFWVVVVFSFYFMKYVYLYLKKMKRKHGI